MADPRVEKMAGVLVEFCLDVKPGELVALRAPAIAAPLVVAVYRRAVERGGHVTPLIGLPGLDEAYYSVANEAQLGFVSPVEEVIALRYDCILRIGAAVNTKSLSNIDPARLAAAKVAQGKLGALLMERAARGGLRRSITLYPTEAYAQDANMSLAEFEDFVYTACRITEPDPVAAWHAQRDMQQRLIDWITPRHTVHIVGPDTDLRMSILGRKWVNSYGRANFPSGEIFTGPVEDTAQGTIRFTYPATVEGREIEDVQLWFENGRVVKATAAKNEDYLHRMLDTDAGARYLGELGIGANFGITRFTKNTLYDEKIGGTVHLALGRSYPETGGVNESAIHWDLVCDLRQGGYIAVDGEMFMEMGQFRV